VHRTGKLLQITCCFIGVLILEQACCARTLELIFRATLSGYIFIFFNFVDKLSMSFVKPDHQCICAA
jgi:hypothetical protein